MIKFHHKIKNRRFVVEANDFKQSNNIIYPAKLNYYYPNGRNVHKISMNEVTILKNEAVKRYLENVTGVDNHPLANPIEKTIVNKLNKHKEVKKPEPIKEAINHPDHYGGKDNIYEAIKVIEAWKLGFHLGNTVKYISRAGKKGSTLEDLKKAKWYLDRYIIMIADNELDTKE